MSEYINREDTIKTIESETYRHDYLDHVIDIIEDIPSADVAPIRHGHWIYDCCDIVCSECGTAFSDEVCYMMRDDTSYHDPRHCLWCGAEMSEDTEY